MTDKRLSIVDDEELVRTMIFEVASRRGWKVSAFDSADRFLASLGDNKPIGVILLDIRMPGRNGLDVFADLRRERRLDPVVFLTGYGEVPDAVDAIKTGAFDFLLKPFDVPGLLDKLDKAWQWRELWRGAIEGLPALTDKEWEVLLLAMQGMHGKEIARQLDVALRTVEFHKGNVLRKMNVETIADLTPLAETLLKLPS